MGPFTPQTQDSTVYTLAAQLMADAANDGDRARIDRALDLVATVERLPSGQWSVPSSTGQGGYVVSRDARTVRLPDYTRRETALQAHFQRPALRAWSSAPTPSGSTRPLPSRRPEDSILDLWPTDGEPCAIHPIARRAADGRSPECNPRRTVGQGVALRVCSSYQPGASASAGTVVNLGQVWALWGPGVPRSWRSSC
jgi:hypothetical protein